MRTNTLRFRKLHFILGLGCLMLGQNVLAQQWRWWIPEALNPFSRPPREEQDRSNEKVDCNRLNEFVVEETMVVDGVKMTRRVVKNESYVRCLQQPEAPWVVKHTQWSPQHEKQFEEFVRRLGSSDCKSVDTCMVSKKANPYLSQEDIAAFHYSDCADFPVYIRAYFAYKNNLPFSYLSGIGQRASEKPTEDMLGEDGLPKKTDYRYTPDGNLPHARTSILTKGKTRCSSKDFFKWSNCLVDVYHTGMARMSSWDQGKDQPVAPDYYSPRITRDSIRPGTVVYDPNGHIAVVYNVAEDGEISLIMASPGGDVKRSAMSRTYVMDGPKSGSGFKNWRPFRVVSLDQSGREQSVRRNSQGEITDGRFVFAKDEEIPDFSMEQYYGHGDLKEVLADGKYQGGKVKYLMDKYEFTKREFLRFARVRLMAQGTKMSPVRETEKALMEVCREFESRADAVNKAVAHGISQKPTPTIYPENIYGAQGEWENYSTPGRDARIRQMIVYLKSDLRYFSKVVKEMKESPISFLEYKGSNFREDLMKAYHRINYACQIRYTNTQNKIVDLTLTDLLNRLALISFDPYQCIEKRWGAVSSTENSSCGNDATKNDWYNVTQFLRNINSRPANLKTNKSLADFKSWVGGSSQLEWSKGQSISTRNTSSEYDVLKVIQGL